MALSKGGIRAYAFIKRGLSEGLAPTKIYESLVRTPLGYRKTTCLNDIRELSGLTTRAGAIKYVPKKYRPTERLLALATYKQTKPFLYEYDIYGFDTYTKEYKSLKRKMGMDELMAVGAAEEVMVGKLKEHGFVTERIVTTEGWRRL